MGAIANIIQAGQQQIDAQFNSMQQAGEYKRQAADLAHQAKIMESNSRMAGYEGQVAAGDQYLQDYKAMGRQAAGLAQNGILSSATGQRLVNESESEAAKAQRRIRLQSDLRSSSLLANSIGLKAQAQGLRRNARVAIWEGFAGHSARLVTDPMKVGYGLSN